MERQEIMSYAVGTLEETLSAKTDSVKYTNHRSGHRGGNIKKTHTDDKTVLDSNPSRYYHRHTVIQFRTYEIENPNHRIMVSKYCPWVEAGVFKVASHLTMVPPIFALPEAEGDEEEEEHEGCVKWWSENQGNKILKKCVEKDRQHGWFLYESIRTKLPEWYLAPKAYIWSADEAQPFIWQYGHPVAWEINPTNRELMHPGNTSINSSIFYDSNWSDDFDGIPNILPLWDDAIDYIFIQDAINAFDSRYGNGFITIVVPNGTSADEKAAIEEKIQNIRTEMGLVIRGDVEETVEIDWMGMGGVQVDFVSHLEKIEDRMSMALRFPKRWLLGDQEGAMESSGKDALQVNIELKAIFQQYVDFIYALLMYHDVIKSKSEVIIKPAFEMQLSEQEKVELENIKTSTIAMKAWLSIDEKRELDGYDPLTDEQKAELMTMMGGGEEGGESSGALRGGATGGTGGINDQKSFTSKRDAFDYVSDFIRNTPISKLSAIMGVSEGSISKIRAKYDDYAKPVLKTDSYEVKQDAVALGNDVFMIKDAILLPSQTKKYGEKECVRSPEAIKKALENPKTPREFRIGVTKFDDHTSRIPLEILNENAVGTARIEYMDELGNGRGSITYDLKEADRILGDNNWMREKTESKEKLNTSVALYSVDKPHNGQFIEDNLDIRSFIFTRKPRNEGSGGK
jgi:hypothetical protein